ncbi:hypothetical protein [Caulobacter phage Cd1]|uniref:Uncharacterized protein n=1 Tax=Caulobacter phage Cd1 TaxID=718008 RepID=F1ADP0_9CAUD|nr:hypothetical protein [Caulobacter phage Cd1]
MNGSIGADFVANHQEDPAVRAKRMLRQSRLEHKRQLLDSAKRYGQIMSAAPAGGALFLAAEKAALAFVDAANAVQEVVDAS